MKISRSILPSAALVLLLAAGCDGGTAAPPVPAFVTALTPLTQTAVVGTPVAAAPQVRVSDDRGRVMAGVPVSFAVTAGEGTVGAATVSTNAQGVATAAWTMGTVAAENTLTATVAGLVPIVFQAAAGAAHPVTLEKVSGDNQTGAVGTLLPEAIAVRVRDPFGNGVPGVPVRFATFVGHLSQYDVSTDAQGYARTRLTLTTRPSSDPVHASAPNLGSVTFRVAAVPGPPATIRKVEGDEQTANAGRHVLHAPAVWVEDSYGNLVPGATVTFTPAAGSGTVTQGVVATDSLGRARVGSWRLGQEGTNRLNVAVAGAPGVAFTATGGPACAELAYTLFTTLEHTLSPACLLVGRNADVITVTFPTARGVDFSVASSSFKPVLGVLDAAGRVLAWTPSNGLDSVYLRLFAPAGTYQLVAGTFPGPVGSYRLRSSAYTGAPVCHVPLIVPDVTIAGQVQAQSCGDEPRNHYGIALRTGDRIRVTLFSPSFAPRLRIYDQYGYLVSDSTGDAPGSTVQLTLAGPFPFSHLVYGINVSPQDGETGTYTLTVERL
ncbi:MAG TPA: Ig-like domain-containing protein [Longimicrobium sp.]